MNGTIFNSVCDIPFRLGRRCKGQSLTTGIRVKGRVAARRAPSVIRASPLNGNGADSIQGTIDLADC